MAKVMVQLAEVVLVGGNFELSRDESDVGLDQ